MLASVMLLHTVFALLADEIPYVHTPVDENGFWGYHTVPDIFFGECTEPVPSFIPNLSGLWTDGIAHFERIEQCGDRFLVTAHGVNHDAKLDGTLQNGVDDVMGGTIPAGVPNRVAVSVRDNCIVYRSFDLDDVVERCVVEGSPDEMMWSFPDLDTDVQLYRTDENDPNINLFINIEINPSNCGDHVLFCHEEEMDNIQCDVDLVVFNSNFAGILKSELCPDSCGVCAAMWASTTDNPLVPTCESAYASPTMSCPDGSFLHPRASEIECLSGACHPSYCCYHGCNDVEHVYQLANNEPSVLTCPMVVNIYLQSQGYDDCPLPVQVQCPDSCGACLTTTPCEDMDGLTSASMTCEEAMIFLSNYGENCDYFGETLNQECPNSCGQCTYDQQMFQNLLIYQEEFNVHTRISTTTANDNENSPSTSRPEMQDDDSTTESPYSCGTTIAECEANYLAALTPSITVPVSTMTAVSECNAGSDWYYNGATSGITDSNGDAVEFCVSSGEYVVMKDGNSYPTCVAYGEPQTTCGNGALVCPEDPGNEDAFGTYGWPGNQMNTLKEAVKRNDFLHRDCPSRQTACEPWDSWWKDQLTGDAFSDISAEQAENVCVGDDNTIYFVGQDYMYNTCVGYSREVFEECNNNQFLCAGHSGEGLYTYGWPGQITRTLAKALSSANYMHPQCPTQLC